MISSPLPEYRCATCRDRGWIVDRAANMAAVCECRSKPLEGEELENHLGAVGLKREHVAMVHERWNESLSQRPLTLFRWAQNCARNMNEAVFAWLYGAPDTGKTMAAAKTVATYVHAGGRRAFFVTALDLAASATREKREFTDGYSRTLDRARTADFLVLDDAGREPEILRWEFEQMLFERFSEQRPTLFTSNRQPCDVMSDEALLSRINSGSVIEMDGRGTRTEMP